MVFIESLNVLPQSTTMSCCNRTNLEKYTSFGPHAIKTNCFYYRIFFNGWIRWNSIVFAVPMCHHQTTILLGCLLFLIPKLGKSEVNEYQPS